MLDHALIRRRRTELGLSQRSLASQIGTTGSWIRNLEAGGNIRDLSVVQLARLADALALDLHEILSGTTQPDARRAAGRDPAGDAAAVGALLHAAGVLTPTAALTDALGWTYERLDAALGDLDQRLRDCGMRVHRLHNRVSIERDNTSVDAEVLETSMRQHLARDNINATEARILHRIVSGQGLPRDPSNADSVALAVLINAGLVEARDPGGTWDLKADVRIGLLLDA